jgi:hypothetical protein
VRGSQVKARPRPRHPQAPQNALAARLRRSRPRPHRLFHEVGHGAAPIALAADALVEAGHAPAHLDLVAPQRRDGLREALGLRRRGRPHVHDAGAGLLAGEAREHVHHGLVGPGMLALDARGRLDPERGQVVPQRLLPRGVRERQARRERRPDAQLLGALDQGVEVALVHVDEPLRIERASVLDDALGDLFLVELGAVGVDAARGAGEGPGDRGRVRRALARRDPRPQPRRRHDEAHAIPPAQVPRRHRRHLLDHEIERRLALLARPQLHRRVDHQPHDVALLALHLAHQQAPAPRARLPRDALEGIARHVVAQLAQLVALAREVRRASHLRPPARATPAGRRHQGRQRRRQHLDADRVREQQRHLVEPLAPQRRAAHLEREAVHAPPPHPQRRDRQIDARPGPRRQIDRGRRGLHPEHARGQGPHGDAAHRLLPAVAQLGLQHHGAAARRPVHARRTRPDHLEPGGAQARDGDQGDRSPHRDGQEHRGPERDDRREARRGAEGDEARPRHRHVEGRSRGMELHCGENTCMAASGALGWEQIRLAR